MSGNASIPQSIEDFIAVHLRTKEKPFVVGELWELQKELSKQLETVKDLLKQDTVNIKKVNVFYFKKF